MACEGITIETTDLNEVIEVGVVGPQGPAGTAGVGVPTGGITGYVLAKASTADYDTEWVAQTGGGGGDFASPPPIGNVTPNSGFFTTISASGLATLPHIHGSLAGNLYVHVKNTSGGTLAKGTPVYITGNVGGSDRVEVSAADFDDAAKMPAVGLLETELAQNGEGNAVIVGELTNVNTAAYSLNTELYVGNNGTLTATAPVLANQIRQSVGIVSRVQTNTGIIVVNMQGELGTMPNAHSSTHHTGGTDAIAPSSIGAQSLFTTTTNPITGNTTIPAGRALIYQVVVSSFTPVTANINLPSSGHQAGDVIVVRSTTPFTSGSTLTIRDGVGNPVDTITTFNQAYRYTANDTGPNAWNKILVDTHTHPSTQITGLGTAATQDSTAFAPATGILPTAITGTAVVDSDARLSDSRTPTAHAASHASAGSDPLAPSDIGAQSLFTAVNVTSGIQTSPHQLSALRAQAVRVATTINFTIRLPETGNQSGDIVEIRAATLSSGAIITIERGIGPSSWTTIATISSQGGKLRFVANGTDRSNWEEDTYFTTNGTIGAPASHTHGNLTNDGKLGSTAGLPVVTTTAGAVTTLALGTANQILRVNSGATAVEFADPADSGGSKTYAVFTATDNQPPATSFAQLDTRNSIAILDFDDASTESAIFVSVMPEAASLASGLVVNIPFMATTAVTGNVRWSVAFERCNTDLDSDSFDTATAATVTTSSTSGIPAIATITCTAIDGITAGDLFRIRIQRLGGDAADTMIGDAEVIAVEVRSAA